MIKTLIEFERSRKRHTPKLTVADLSEIIGIGAQNIYYALRKKGGIDPVATFKKGVNKTRLFDREEFIAWAKLQGWDV